MNDKTKTSIDHREMQRRSLDKIRINNPFDFDAVVVWDGFQHIIPRQSYAVKERYIAEKYLREMAERIITEGADLAAVKENERRVKSGMSEMDKSMRTNEKVTFDTPFYANWGVTKINTIKQYNLYGGIVEEFGMQFLPTEIPQMNQPDPNKGLIDQLDIVQQPSPVAPTISHPLTQPQSTTTPIMPPETPKVESLIDSLEGLTQPQLRAMARDKGMETQNTDKKADLIRLLSE